MSFKIAVCITFHYNKQREAFLIEVVEGLKTIQASIELTIICNEIPNDLKNLLKVFSTDNFKLDFFIPKGLGHPYLLSWSHYLIFKSKLSDINISHFLYLEDDLKFTKNNFNYWVKSRGILKDLNGYPAFFRYEKNNSFKQYSTDVPEPMSIYDCKVIGTSCGDYFINIVYPYQGMYLYDRELMLEYFNSPSFNPDFDHGIFNSLFASKPFNIREKAALGLTYLNIPKGFRSRTFLPYNQKENILESECLIHHIPNNYTQDNSSPYGKIEINGIFKKKTTNLFLNHAIKLFLKTILRQILKK